MEHFLLGIAPLRDWHTEPNLEELQMYCKSHYLSYVTEVGIYKALP